MGEIKVCKLDNDESNTNEGIIFLNQTKPFTLDQISFTNFEYDVNRIYVEGEAEGVLTINNVSFHSTWETSYIADRPAVINNPIDGGFLLSASSLSLCGLTELTWGGQQYYPISATLEDGATMYFSNDSTVNTLLVREYGNFLVAPSDVIDCLLGPEHYNDKKQLPSLVARPHNLYLEPEAETESTDISWDCGGFEIKKDSKFYIYGTNATLSGFLIFRENAEVGDPGDPEERTFTVISHSQNDFYPGVTIYGDLINGKYNLARFLSLRGEGKPVDVQGNFHWEGWMENRYLYADSKEDKLMTYESHSGRNELHDIFGKKRFFFEAHPTYLLSTRTEKNNSLPAWAIGLIVTGSVLFVVLLVVGGFLFWRRRRARQNGEEEDRSLYVGVN